MKKSKTKRTKRTKTQSEVHHEKYIAYQKAIIKNKQQNRIVTSKKEEQQRLREK